MNNDVVDKAMLDKQSINNGYFDKHDFMLSLVMLPNQHINSDQAEQTFYRLLQESVIEEMEPRKYRLTKKPSTDEGKAKRKEENKGEMFKMQMPMTGSIYFSLSCLHQLWFNTIAGLDLSRLERPIQTCSLSKSRGRLETTM